MANKKNRKSKIGKNRPKGPLKRLSRIAGEALLQGVCRSLGFHIGTAAFMGWWVLMGS